MTDQTDDAVDEQESRVQHRLKKRKPRTAVYELPEDANDSELLQPLLLAAGNAERNALLSPSKETQKTARDAKKKYNEAKAKIPVIRLHLRAIGNRAYDTLLSTLPATDEQIEAAKALVGNDAHLPYDTDQFPPQLLSMAIGKIEWPDGEVDEKITVDDVTTLLTHGGFSSGDLVGLLNTAIDLNVKTSKVETILKG